MRSGPAKTQSDAAYLLTLAEDRLRLWDVASGKPLFSLRGDRGQELPGNQHADVHTSGNQVAFSPDGRRFVVQSNGLYVAEMPGGDQTQDVQTLAEAMSGYRYDEFEGRVPLTRDELLARWKKIHPEP